MLHAVDYVIIAVYLIGIVVIGVLASRRSRGTIESFFLGNNSLPWWALATSGISSNIDISGTSINAAVLYAMGTRAFTVEFRGGVSLALALFLVVGKWTRRSRCMTVAEWVAFRFGHDKQGHVARVVTAIAVLIRTVFEVTYFAIGGGIFVAEFLDVGDWLGLPRVFWAASILTALATVYTVVSGLEGVVWTDLAQSAIIFAVVVAVCVWSWVAVALPSSFQTTYPLKNGSFAVRNHTLTSWSSILPVWDQGIPSTSPYSVFNNLWFVFIFYLTKVLIEGVAGPVGYTAQRYMSTASDRDAGRMTLLWIILLSLRWPFTTVMVSNAIAYGHREGTPIENPEAIIAVVINEMVPIVLRGFLVAALLASGMSTFDSTVNAGAAYYTKDIIHAYVRPNASQSALLWHSRIASVVIVVAGVLPTMFLGSINQVWAFLTMSLGGSMLIPLLLRWLYWRANGASFALATLGGILAATLKFAFLPDITEYAALGLVMAISAAFMVGGIVWFPPTDMAALRNFYRLTRPPGFWGPVTAGMNISHAQRKAIRRENLLDMVVALGVAWPFQAGLFAFWIEVSLGQWTQAAVLAVITGAAAVGLYFLWWKRIDEEVVLHDEDGKVGAGVDDDQAVLLDDDAEAYVESIAITSSSAGPVSPHYGTLDFGEGEGEGIGDSSEASGGALLPANGRLVSE